MANMTAEKAKQLQTAVRSFATAEEQLDSASTEGAMIAAAEEFVRAGHVVSKLVGPPASPAIAPFVGEEPGGA